MVLRDEFASASASLRSSRDQLPAYPRLGLERAAKPQPRRSSARNAVANGALLPRPRRVHGLPRRLCPRPGHAARGYACLQDRARARGFRRPLPSPVAVPTPAQRAPARERAKRATSGSENGSWSRRVPEEHRVTLFHTPTSLLSWKPAHPPDRLGARVALGIPRCRRMPSWLHHALRLRSLIRESWRRLTSV